MACRWAPDSTDMDLPEGDSINARPPSTLGYLTPGGDSVACFVYCGKLRQTALPPELLPNCIVFGTLFSGAGRKSCRALDDGGGLGAVLWPLLWGMQDQEGRRCTLTCKLCQSRCEASRTPTAAPEYRQSSGPWFGVAEPL